MSTGPAVLQRLPIYRNAARTNDHPVLTTPLYVGPTGGVLVRPSAEGSTYRPEEHAQSHIHHHPLRGSVLLLVQDISCVNSTLLVICRNGVLQAGTSRVCRQTLHSRHLLSVSPPTLAKTSGKKTFRHRLPMQPRNVMCSAS